MSITLLKFLRELFSTSTEPLTPDVGFRIPVNNEQFRQFQTTIAGITYANPDGSSRIKIASTCSYGQKLRLLQEPKNKYDPDAVKVLTRSGQQLGYLSASHAQEVKATLQGTSKNFSRIEAYFVESGTFNSENGIRPYCSITIRKYKK